MKPDDRAIPSDAPSNQAPKLPEGRRQLEQLLVKLDEFLASVSGITEARDLERRRIQTNVDRIRRGLPPNAQVLKHDVQPPRRLPAELSQLVENDVDPEERAAILEAVAEATAIERELERLMAGKPTDVETLQAICTLINRTCEADRKAHQPYERLANRIRIKLDESDRPEKQIRVRLRKPRRIKSERPDLTFLRGAIERWHQFGTENENPTPASADDLLYKIGLGNEPLNWDKTRVSKAMKLMFPDGGHKQYKRLCSAKALEGFINRSDDGTRSVEAAFR
jgi:hypothetical protein